MHAKFERSRRSQSSGSELTIVVVGVNLLPTSTRRATIKSLRPSVAFRMARRTSAMVAPKNPGMQLVTAVVGLVACLMVTARHTVHGAEDGDAGNSRVVVNASRADSGSNNQVAVNANSADSGGGGGGEELSITQTKRREASVVSDGACALVDDRIVGTGSIAVIAGVADAAACCVACGGNPACLAFTWAKPGARSPHECWLKDNVDVVDTPDNTTTSGFRGGASPRCPPPPAAPYPLPSALQSCPSFPDPFLTSSGDRVTIASGWRAHRTEMLLLLEHYMMGTSPPRTVVEGDLIGTSHVTSVCDQSGCVSTDATLRNYTLRVGPTKDQTHPFDLFVYFPTAGCQPATPPPSQAPPPLRPLPRSSEVPSARRQGLIDARSRSTPPTTATTTATSKGRCPIFVYNGEGFESGVGFGDLTAQGLSVLLKRGYAVAQSPRDSHVGRNHLICLLLTRVGLWTHLRNFIPAQL